jgi:NAD(P)-dependent dehydrogenase (short-subunit alcohol dehydrogenase family)
VTGGALDTSEVPDYPGLLGLDGRGVVVAGAGQGIGRQTVHALAQAGARVFCIDSVEEAAHHVASEVDGVPCVADIRDRRDVERALDEARRALPGVDGIVDIVGMARYAGLLDVSDEDWDWTFQMVLRHAFLLAQIGGRIMGEQVDPAPAGDDGVRGRGSAGAMVFIASVSGLTSAPLHAPYGAAKAALISLVRTAAVELGPMGVRVNGVAPGVVWTPRVSQLLGEDGRRSNAANTPVRRIAEPRDVAAACAFLMSDLADYITGQVLTVDGGVSAKFPYPMEG